MSKKSFLLVIILILAVFGALGWYFIFRTPEMPGASGGAEEPNLFPFGEDRPAGGQVTDIGQIPDATGSSTIDLSNIGEKARAPRLRQVSSSPTAGAVAYDSGDSVMIRYTERATGHIYETESSETSSERISNVTIPKVIEAIWSESGSKLLIRYLREDGETIRTFSARVSTSSQPDRAIEGLFLPDNIASIAVSGDRIFYLDQNVDGARGIRANFDGSGKTAIFGSTFGDWIAVWTSKDIALYPRPSASAIGSGYLLNPAVGTYSKKIGGVYGLAVLPNSDGSYLLYSGQNGKRFAAAAVDGKTADIADIGISTLIDKCVWSKKERGLAYCAVPKSSVDGNYPDDWYKGKVSFSDSLWKIWVETGETEEMLDPEIEAGLSMDITKLHLDGNEKIILFTDKKDMSLWRYEI